MAVRFRKYFKECKPIKCGGRKGKYCPELPKRQNGTPKDCGVWLVEMFDESRNWVSLSFPDVRSRRDAERRLSLLITDRERGRLNLPKQRKIPTLAEYGKRYLELYATGKDGTLRKKIATVKALTRRLGEYRLDKITGFLIEKYRLERQKDGRQAGTINDEFTSLSHLFNKAVKEGIVEKNPCKDIKRLKTEQKRDRILTNDEISLLFTRLQGRDRMAVLHGLFCGLRLNETLKLTWDNFDFTKSLLCFVASKTGKLVTVPISDFMVKELMDYKATHTGVNLFVDREVTHSVVVNYCHYFSDMFRRLGIHNFTYHCLRHTFASLQGDLGTGAITTKELLGHSSLDMTLKYSHTGLDSKRRAIEAMTEHIIGIAKNDSPPLTLKAQGTVTGYGENTA